MKLHKNDILFLLKKTQISLKSLINLIEEDRDFNLVINAVALNIDLNDTNELSLLSDKLKLKLILYHRAKDKDYDISEKSYIADLLINNYNQIYKTCDISQKKQKKEIKQFISIINDINIDSNKLNTIASNFNKLGYKNISNHLSDWIDIIRQSKTLISSSK